MTIKYARAHRVPWANGRGHTTELVSWERSLALSSAGTPAWRLSIAELEGPAAFSTIPGVRRHFLPIGSSVTLAVNGVPRRIPDHTVTEFAGDDDVELRELDRAPGHAVNLMVRGGADTGPWLRVGVTDDDAFRSCLLAVALEQVGDIDRFDVLAPDPTAIPGHPLRFALITTTGTVC